MSDDSLVFRPHRMERVLGGDTGFACALADVTRLAKAPRSARVPRSRLIVSTRDGVDAFFLVSKLDAVIGQLDEAITSAGGHPEKVLDLSDAEVPTPESHPDDSAMMNWMHSGWPHVASLVFWVLFFIATINDTHNWIWLVWVAGSSCSRVGGRWWAFGDEHASKPHAGVVIDERVQACDVCASPHTVGGPRLG